MYSAEAVLDLYIKDTIKIVFARCMQKRLLRRSNWTRRAGELYNIATILNEISSFIIYRIRFSYQKLNKFCCEWNILQNHLAKIELHDLAPAQTDIKRTRTQHSRLIATMYISLHIVCLCVCLYYIDCFIVRAYKTFCVQWALKRAEKNRLGCLDNPRGLRERIFKWFANMEESRECPPICSNCIIRPLYEFISSYASIFSVISVSTSDIPLSEHSRFHWQPVIMGRLSG